MIASRICRALLALLDTIPADPGNDGSNQSPPGRSEVHLPSWSGRLDTDACQRLVARPVIGERGSARFQHLAEDFAEARPLVLHAGQGGGHQDERRRVCRVRHQRRRRAGAEGHSRNHRQNREQPAPRRAPRKVAAGPKTHARPGTILNAAHSFAPQPHQPPGAPGQGPSRGAARRRAHGDG